MRIAAVTIFVWTAVLLTACETFEETVVDPFVGQDRYYSIYGYLDASATEHQLRVTPVRRTPERITSTTEPNAFIDARVVSTDLETGSSVEWRHELLLLRDGTFAHVFRTPLRVIAGRSYMIDVIRSDEATSSAVTTIPSLPSFVVPDVSSYRSVDGHSFQDIHLEGIVRPTQIEVIYDVSDGGRTQARVARQYGRVGAAGPNGGWDFTLDLLADGIAVIAAVESEIGFQVFLNEMGVRVRWTDEEWPITDGAVDPDVLAQPGGLSNVENGYGFVGSVGEYIRFWPVVDSDMKVAMGFQP